VIFNAGTFELQVADGLEFSQQRTGPLRPNIDYELTVLRLGYMIDSPHQGGTFLRGNDEIQLEGVGGAIFTGPGKTLGGLSLVYRRNFLAPGARLVPYLSGGGGGVYCDSYLDHQQRALGSAFEFDLQAGLGLRYRLATRVTLDAEVTYRHLSNADTAARNFGVNSIGGVVGASFTF
jgi:opacity protein-like surface antigen